MNCNIKSLSAIIGLFLMGAAFTPNTAFAADSDGDGVDSATDCNDADAAIGGPDSFYQDADGDGYGNPHITVSSCVQPVGHVSDKTDCNDTEASIFTGAPEVVGDGVDQDCSGSDLLLPVTQQVFLRFVAGEYGGVRPTAEVFTHEYGSCNAATQCKVDLINARFVITDADYVFQDLKNNATGALHCGKDGREPVTAVDWSYAPRCAARSGGGIGRSTVIRLAEETVQAAIAAQDLVIQARFTEVVTRLDALEAANLAQDRQIAENQGQIAANGAIITGLQTWQTGVNSTLQDHTAALGSQDLRIRSARSEGMYLWAGPAYRMTTVKPLNGDTNGDADGGKVDVRGSAFHMGGLSLQTGVDGSGYRAFISFEAMGATDGVDGDSADFGMLVGLGGAWEFSRHGYVSGQVQYMRLDSHSNLLTLTARGHGFGAAAEIGYDLVPKTFDVVPYFQMGAGGERYGAPGSQEGSSYVRDGSGGMFTPTVGIRIGVGPAND